MSKSEMATAQSTQSASQNSNTSSVPETSSMQCKEHPEKSSFTRDKWAGCLDKMRTTLVDRLRMEDLYLLNSCLSMGILNDRQYEMIKAKETCYHKADAFCQEMRLIDTSHYILFLSILKSKEGQPALAKEMIECLGIEVSMSRIHEWSLLPKRQELDDKALQDKRKQISVLTTWREWDEGGAHHSMKESMISEDGGQIYLSDVTLNIPPKSLEQPVLISTKKIDHDHVLKQKVNFTGLQDVVKPGIKLCLKPHGQKFLRHVSIELHQNVPEGSSVLIFHKHVDQKRATEWTNITEKCNIVKEVGKLILKIDQFSWYYVVLVSAAVSAIAVGAKVCLALLNNPAAQCIFYAYFKEPEKPLHVFVESMKYDCGSTTRKHIPESGYKLCGDNVSYVRLIDQELLQFQYDGQNVARLPLQLNMCHKQGQLFVLPVKMETAYPPNCLNILRYGLNQKLCVISMKEW